jgi:hypothetical protein
VGAGTNRSLVAVIKWFDLTTAAAPTVTSIVFNTTENFTFGRRGQLNYAGDNYITVEVWYLDNPTDATANVVATLSENTPSGIEMTVIEYTDANNGIGANTGGGTGNNIDPTCSITTLTATGMIVGGISGGLVTQTPFAAANGESEIDDGTVGSMSYWTAELAAAAGAQTFGATANATGRWAIAVVELLAAPSAAAEPPRHPAVYNDLAVY